MKKILYLLFVVIILSTGAGCSNKNTSNQDTSFLNIQEKGSIIIGLDDSFPPMGYIDIQTGELIGFDIDLAKEVFKRLGINTVFQPINWTTKELELNNKTIDCIWNGMSKTENLDNTINLSFPYMKNNQCILVKNDSNFYNLSDLKNKIIGVQADSSAEHALDKNIDFKNSLKSIVVTDNYTKAILELNNKTIDAIAIDEIVAKFYLNTEKTNDYRILKNSDQSVVSLACEDYVIGFRKNDNELKSHIEKTLVDMEKDGTLENISYKWFGSDVTCINK